MRLLLCSSAAVLLSLAGCQKSDPKPPAVLDQDWYSTFQPGSAGYTVYSTTHQNLGWQYDGFRLNADGTYLEYGLGPADEPEERPGTWREEGSQTFRITFNNPDRAGYLLRIIDAQAGQLQARRD